VLLLGIDGGREACVRPNYQVSCRKRRQMPVGLSSAVASTIKIQIGCNIRHLLQFVNVLFPDKSRQERRVISLTNDGLFRPDHRKAPAGLNCTTLQRISRKKGHLFTPSPITVNRFRRFYGAVGIKNKGRHTFRPRGIRGVSLGQVAFSSHVEQKGFFIYRKIV
jgi:hypothetical protein